MRQGFDLHMDSRKEQSYLPALDGLRGISILAVMASHAGFPLARAGFLGVDSFFVLSGYLITSLLVSEHENTGNVSLASFYMRRALRLFPALFIVLAVCSLYTLLFVSGQQAEGNWHQIAASLIYMGNYTRLLMPLPIVSILDTTWSLAVEEQFYIVWPLLLIFVLLRYLQPRTILRVVVLAALASAAWRANVWISSYDVYRVISASDTHADGLLIGCALALARAWGYAPKGRLLTLLARAALFVGIPLVGYLDLFVAEPYDPLCRGWYTLFATLIGVLILHVIDSPPRISHALLTWKPLVTVGLVSYGAYLWHLPVFQWLPLHNSNWADWPTQFARVAVVTILTLASYHLIERPFLQLKKRFVRRNPASLPVPIEANTA